MSKVASFEQVRDGVAHYGPRATLVTIGDDGRPHVVTSLVDLLDDTLVVGVGGRTRTNVSTKPVMTLVWQPPAGDEYLLIVDANVESIGDPNDRGVARVELSVDGAIQHRLAGLEPGASSCRAPDAL